MDDEFRSMRCIGEDGEVAVRAVGEMRGRRGRGLDRVRGGVRGGVEGCKAMVEVRGVVCTVKTKNLAFCPVESRRPSAIRPSIVWVKQMPLQFQPP